MRRNRNISSHAVGQSLHRQLNEHHQSNHHNNQVPTDQFVMNRPNVAPDLSLPRYVFVDSSANRLNLPKEVIKQEPTENKRDHPRLFRPTPYRLLDPRFAAIGPPVDPLLRALRQNPNSSMQKAASDEISTANIIRTDCARSGVPILHQSSSRSGKEVEQEHGQSRIDHPQVTRPITNSLYDPRYATIGLPVDPILRAFKQNPNFSNPKATSDESSTSNNIRNHYALSGVPRLHQSSHSGRGVAEQQHTQSRTDYPRVTRPIPNRLYDPRYAAIGQPVDPFLRAFKQNPNWRLPKREE